MVPARARPQPALLGPVGAGREEVRVVRRFAFLVGVLTVALLAPLAAQGAPSRATSRSTRFSRVEVSGDRVYVLYVLDLAEIPTFQAKQSRRRSTPPSTPSGSPPARRPDRRRPPARSRPADARTRLPPGAGGLHTTRLEVILRGAAAQPGRAGSPTATRTTPAGSAGGDRRPAGATRTRRPSSRDELRAYPKDLLSSPLDVTETRRRRSPRRPTPPPTADPRQARSTGAAYARSPTPASRG